MTKVSTARMEGTIEIDQKSREQSAAHAEAEAARARAVEAEERVKTVREGEAARRRREVEVLIAEKEADEVRIAAAAEQVRATVQAEAQRLLNWRMNATRSVFSCGVSLRPRTRLKNSTVSSSVSSSCAAVRPLADSASLQACARRIE